MASRSHAKLWIAMFAAGLLALSGQAGAAERRLVPTVTIYPGDIIREDMIADAAFTDAAASTAFINSRPLLIGKVAKRTLLPGQGIPTMAVGEPRLITVGARVRVIYEDGGLVVSTYASALQAGAAGDFITLRNVESGTIIGGTVAADGSVHIGAS